MRSGDSGDVYRTGVMAVGFFDFTLLYHIITVRCTVERHGATSSTVLLVRVLCVLFFLRRPGFHMWLLLFFNSESTTGDTGTEERARGLFCFFSR